MTKIIKFWIFSPVHWGIQTVYLSVFDTFFPSNYFIIQVFNVVGKLTSTILLYPLIRLLTRNKLVAIVATLIYAVHYSSFGSLQQYSTGVEYWAIVFIILFSLSYRRILIKSDYRLISLFISLILLYLGLAFGLYRLSGFIIILFTTELILFWTKHSSLKAFIFRLAFFILLPVLIIFVIHRPTQMTGNFLGNALDHLLAGNLLIFITPLSGLALTFAPRPFIEAFEPQFLTSFYKFLSYYIHNFALAFGLVILIAAYIFPVKFIRFLIISIIGNLIFGYFLFFFSSHYTGTPRLDIIPTAAIGMFIFSLSISFGMEWFLSGRKNILLAILFCAPLVTLLLTTLTWLFKIDQNGSIVYQDGMYRYLTVPSIATSIFLAAAITLIVQAKHSSRIKKFFSYSLVLGFITFLLFSSYKELKIYKTERDTGRDLSLMESSQKYFYENFIQNKGDVVIYYISPLSQNPEDIKAERSLYPQITGWWSYLRQYYLYGYNTKGMGCIMVLAYPWHQKEATMLQEDGQIKFEYPALCPINKPEAGSEKIFAEIRRVTLPLDKLFAFTIRKGQIINVTEATKRELLKNHNPVTATDSSLII